MSEVNSYNINIHQGETWSLKLTVTDDDGNAKDLTGYSAKMEIRNRAGGTLYKALSSGTEITITAGSGEVKCDLTATETAALNFSKAYYDIYIKTGVNVTYLLRGFVIIERRITE